MSEILFGNVVFLIWVIIIFSDLEGITTSVHINNWHLVANNDAIFKKNQLKK